MYGFTTEIKMLVSAKALPTGYLKESAFIKHVLIYLIQQTSVQLWVKRQLEIEGVERILSVCPAL